LDSITVRKSTDSLSDNFRSRKGRFKVSIDSTGNDELLLKFMSNFLIVRAEYRYDTEVIEYSAVSELFDPVDEGYEIPEYEFIINSEKNGSIDVRAIKCDQEGKGSKLLRTLRKLDG